MSKHSPALALIAIASAFAASAEAAGGSSKLALIRVTDRLYVSVDTYYAQENSVVYIGDSSVTVVGATWTALAVTRISSPSAPASCRLG
jgi:hypothetical protein